MKALEPIFDIIGEILAIVLVITFAVLILNANFEFINNVTIMQILQIIQNNGSLALMEVVGLEAISKRNIIIRIAFYALLALIVVFLFFPDTYANLITAVGQIK